MEQTAKKLILYGAGEVGREMALSLTLAYISIACFCDSDRQKCSALYCGYPVKTIDAIKGAYPKGSFQILITMAEESAEAVKTELIDEHIFQETDFYDEEEDSLGLMKFLKAISKRQGVSIPQNLAKNFLDLNEEKERAVKQALLAYYYHAGAYEDLDAEGKKDFSDHLYGRLENDRNWIVPWLDSICPLDGASVLEIGCGTGTSTVALCEQKSFVTAIDVSRDAMEAAKARLRAYGLTADFMHVNAANLLDALPHKKFDFIIYFASLEHMSFAERIQSLRAAFQMLTANGHVVLIEIPNRLCYFDGHTSQEPFYHWLPNDLAMEYAKFTQREKFNRGFDAANASDVLRFVRWGRGVSYHELEIALGGRKNIQVGSSLHAFLKWPDSNFKKILRMLGPKDVHEGFYEDNLNIALRAAGR